MSIDSNDRAEARAEAAAAKARAKSMRPWYRKKRWILLGVLALFIVIGVATSGGGDDDTSVSSDNGTTSNQASGSHAAEDDVVIDSCEKGAIGWEAALTITNHTSKRSNYLVELSLVDGSGTKVGDMIASSNNVDPGQVAKEDAGDCLQNAPRT